MKSDNGRWPFQWSEFKVQLIRSDFFKIVVMKALGPSLGVNWMWTKKNDHAPKNERIDFVKYMSKKGNVERMFQVTIVLSFFTSC